MMLADMCKQIEKDTGVKRKHINAVIRQYLELLKEQLIYYKVHIVQFMRVEIVYDNRVKHYVLRAYFDHRYYNKMADARRKQYEIYKSFTAPGDVGGSADKGNVRLGSRHKSYIGNDADIAAEDKDAAVKA